MVPELWRNSKSAITDGVSDTSLFLGAVLPSPLFVIANVSVVGIIMGASDTQERYVSFLSKVYNPSVSFEPNTFYFICY